MIDPTPKLTVIVGNGPDDNRWRNTHDVRRDEEWQRQDAEPLSGSRGFRLREAGSA